MPKREFQPERSPPSKRAGSTRKRRVERVELPQRGCRCCMRFCECEHTYLAIRKKEHARSWVQEPEHESVDAAAAGRSARKFVSVFRTEYPKEGREQTQAPKKFRLSAQPQQSPPKNPTADLFFRPRKVRPGKNPSRDEGRVAKGDL